MADSGGSGSPSPGVKESAFIGTAVSEAGSSSSFMPSASSEFFSLLNSVRYESVIGVWYYRGRELRYYQS